MITIVKLTADRISDLNQANQPFEVIGRMALRLENSAWRYTEVLSDTVGVKQYSNYDGAAEEDYIGFDPDRVAYLAYDDGKCVGRILMARTWNEYGHVEDISVRGQGIGTALLAKAEAWARNAVLAPSRWNVRTTTCLPRGSIGRTALPSAASTQGFTPCSEIRTQARRRCFGTKT